MESIEIDGIPETMLWTLHNRASEAMHPDASFRDPEAVRIYKSIAYDYERSFGKPNGSHAERSRCFDVAVQAWMAARDSGTVVELGCGLETQWVRCDNGKQQWICVDVPESIEIRERFMSPSARCRHVPVSALDSAWMEEIDADQPIFVSAQGLLMYFEPAQVESLVGSIFERFDDVEMMFDTIPRWLSRKTIRGLRITPSYTTPPMPWGLNRHEIVDEIRRWNPRIVSVEVVDYQRFRGIAGVLFPVMCRLPLLCRYVPTMVKVRSIGAVGR